MVESDGEFERYSWCRCFCTSTVIDYKWGTITDPEKLLSWRKSNTGEKHTMNTADIGFEKEIWDAACVLRGNMDASEYKNVILGLIFLKYISDSFEAKYRELVDEGEGFEEDRDEYDAENIFFVPAGAR